MNLPRRNPQSTLSIASFPRYACADVSSLWLETEVHCQLRIRPELLCLWEILHWREF